MVLSRVHPKVSKDQVVFTALFLIFLALILARILPSLVPQQGPVLEFVVGGFFLFFSYNMVNILVGGAIDKAINEGIQKHQQENSRSYALTKRALYGVNLNTVLQDCPG